jgi:hypothetical protein
MPNLFEGNPYLMRKDLFRRSKKGVRSLEDKSDEWKTRSQSPDEKSFLCALASLREIRLLIVLVGTRTTTKFVDNLLGDTHGQVPFPLAFEH